MISRAERWAPKGEHAPVPQVIEIAIKATPKALSFLGTSLELTESALTKVFGPFPIQLNKFEHEQVLLGMAAAAASGATPYNQILDALRSHDEIEVRLAP